MRDFFWEGFSEDSATHLVAWNEVSRPKEVGGLGIGNMRKRNQALLAKWLWRFPLEFDSLWYRVVAGKDGLAQNTGEASRVTFRCPWKSIQSAFVGFSQQVRWKVGSREIVRFWEDYWIEGGPLCLRFPHLYRIPPLQNQPISLFVAEIEDHEDGRIVWDFRFPRNLTDREVSE
ncbi:hypothetical protein L484_016389 [Morus notabilis]|uniref:Uncharacterized protein n=1 Tax=Morus notabilis TaxID=981085 RepID=W9RNC9_9ROSA|nr:hypothetical protein L484_016389 [Morus notabilis]